MVNWKLFAGGAVVVLIWFLLVRSTNQASHRADVAEGRVQVLEAERLVSEIRAKADSVALDSVRTATAAREAELTAGRLQARQGAARAAEMATEAQGEVRAVLDSLGASHEALDRLEAAHAAEVAAVTRDRDLADSLVVVLRDQLHATETALMSERGVHQAFTAENQALRDQVAALKSVQRRQGLELWATRGAVVLVALTTLR